MLSKSPLNIAVKSALALSALTTTAFSSQVVAQDSDVERIQVTGSRIKRADMETASPVTVIDAKAIGAIGATSIDQVLQRMTATGGAMTNPGINNGSGGNSHIDLRGLGAQRTLVLVNGRRMINSGTGAASTVDLNTIPVSMVKRIEVLKDGASAVYGSDAVAGVVNVILKRDFEGMELNVQGGVSGENDAEETSIDFTVGGSFDKGNIVFGVQYMDRGEASQADRGYSDCPLTEAGDGSAPYCTGSSYAAGGTIWDGETYPTGYKGTKRKTLSGGNGDGTGAGDGSYHEFSNDDKYNYAKDSYLFTPMQRLNISASGTYELSDTTTFFAESTYSKRWSEQQMAPQPVWFDFTYTEEMGDSLLGNCQTGEDGVEKCWNHGDEISYGRRMTDSGQRGFSQVVDTVRIVAGVEGELDNGWMWDTSIVYGRNDSVDRLSNLHNMASIQEDIEAGTFNPLDQNDWSAENIAPYVYTEQNSGGSDLMVLAATLSGDVMDLPAGTLGFAAGIEHRSENAWFIPDSLTAQGLANDPAVESTNGGFEVNEAYAEFAIPLLNDAPLADALEMTAAIRYFDYSTFGSDNTWKLGLTWKLNDELMVRGVRSTAFRAPTVDELFGGKATSFDQVKHPASSQTQAEVTVGGNDQLTPEEADTLTFGIVYEPSFLEGSSVTLDYYNIDITNAITSVSSQYVADLCLGTDGSLINQGNGICQASNISLDNTGRISFDNGLQNIGNEKTSGIDLNLAYTFDAAGLNWRAGLDTTYLIEYDFEAAGNFIEYQGVITNGQGGYAEIKSNFSLDVNADNWNASYTARYISGMDSEACIGVEETCYAPSTGSVVYHDLSGAYHVTESTTISGGVNNLFDKQPPYYTGNNDSNTDPFTYDVLGRYFFVKATMTF